MAQLEQEVKLDVGPDWSTPDLTGLLPGARSQPLPTLALEATYYDTAGLRLAKRRLTLRFRRETEIGRGTAGPGPYEAWTVKLPASGDARALARTEVTWPPGPSAAPGPQARIPVHPQAVEFLAGITLGEPLEPVAHLATNRRRTGLSTSDGRPLAEVAHDSVTGVNLGLPPAGGPAPTGAPERSSPVTFTEVEVELSEGSALEVLEAVVARLEALGARRSSRKSKLATVLQSRSTPPSPAGHVGPIAPKKDGRALVASVLQGQARACLDVLWEHDPPIRLGDPDPEHVHRSRVATRRFRTVMRAYTSLVTGHTGDAPDELETWFATLGEEMRWVGQAFGDARDADVRLLWIEQHGATLPAADATGTVAVLEAARDDQRRSHQGLLQVMATGRYIGLLRELEVLGRATSATSAGDPGLPHEFWARLSQPASTGMPELGRRQWRSLRTAVGRLGDRPTDEALHRVRVKTKRLRYMAEVAMPALEGPNRRAAGRTIVAATALQDILGEVHDSAVNEQWLREVASRGGTGTGRAKSATARATALAVGQLLALAREDKRVSTEAWPGAWSRLDRKKLMRWTARP